MPFQPEEGAVLMAAQAVLSSLLARICYSSICNKAKLFQMQSCTDPSGIEARYMTQLAMSFLFLCVSVF
jgi:hypothetical protein